MKIVNYSVGGTKRNTVVLDIKPSSRMPSNNIGDNASRKSCFRKVLISRALSREILLKREMLPVRMGNAVILCGYFLPVENICLFKQIPFIGKVGVSLCSWWVRIFYHTPDGALTVDSVWTGFVSLAKFNNAFTYQTVTLNCSGSHFEFQAT